MVIYHRLFERMSQQSYVCGTCLGYTTVTVFPYNRNNASFEFNKFFTCALRNRQWLVVTYGCFKQKAFYIPYLFHYTSCLFHESSFGALLLQYLFPKRYFFLCLLILSGNLKSLLLRTQITGPLLIHSIEFIINYFFHNLIVFIYKITTNSFQELVNTQS